MGNMIKGVIFDYGGTLDSNGQHWASVIHDAYKDSGLNIEEQLYERAYIYAERKMATQPLILPTYNFKQMLETKIMVQFDFLKENGEILDRYKINTISQHAYNVAKYHTQNNKTLLEDIYGQVPMVVVSNFYGNLKTVLKDFDLLGYFDHVIESAAVGVRKPDVEIFKLGVGALNVQAESCIVIGDSYRKDIVPAKECGCTTIWLKGRGWTDETELLDESSADHIVSDINEVRPLIKKLII